MTDRSYPVIVSYQVVTASAADYASFRSINPKKVSNRNYRELLMTGMGYNPGSKEGNRQECKVCGKGGSECIGHPVVMDMSGTNSTFLSEFGISTITSITSLICTKCFTIVKDKEGLVFDYEGLLKLKNRYVCKCKGSPSISAVKEAKIPESERTLEWRDGRQHERKALQLSLIQPIPEVKKLIERVDFSSLGISKENILNLFYKKIFVLPVSVQPMNFSRGSSATVEEETKMLKLYIQMAGYVLHDSISNLEQNLRMLAVGSHNDRFSGTPSHLDTNDGKKGLFRGEGMNKRSVGTGRAVLTPLLGGRSGEITCPAFIMENLQYEYKVAVHNKEWLQREVGRSVTHLVIPIESSTTNMRVTYKKISPQTKLRLGDRVLKRLVDGDYVVFFRNPTLWRHSLIGYPVKQSNDSKNYCIGLHETNTPGHGADYDGDEGNLMVGASVAARIETQMMAAMYHLFSGRSGEPIVGIYYNGIVGAYVLSTDDNIDLATFSMLKDIIEAKDIKSNKSVTSRITELKIDENYYEKAARDNKIPYLSGRILISMLLPRTLNYTRGDVVIKKGIMISGKLKSSDVSHGLILAIAEIERWHAPYMFVDRGYSMMSAYISSKCLTITALDYVMPGELQKQIIPNDYPQELQKAIEDIKILEESKAQKTKASIDRIEENIEHILSKLKLKITKLLETGEYSKTNGAIISYVSGARGNVGNISATICSVEQIYSGASRYDKKSLRPSFYSERNSTDIRNRNFVSRSYSSGLTPPEVMSVANAARAQAFNTHMGVPISGATSKQVTNHLADIHVSYSLSTCRRNGRIMDCLHGIGCDSTMLAQRKTPHGLIEMPLDPLALLDRMNES
jgi:DNA-directed RNA polymerase beta' subunit